MKGFRFNKLSIRIWFFVLCLPVIASGATAADLQFTPEEQEWLSSNKKIVVGGEKDRAPFDFIEGTGNMPVLLFSLAGRVQSRLLHT